MSNPELAQVVATLADLSKIVGNMVRAQYAAPHEEPKAPASSPAPSQPTPAPATAKKVGRRSTRKASPPAPTVVQSAPVKAGVVTIHLTKVKATQNSLVIRETVNGKPLPVETTGYAGGFVGDMHVRRELLQALGVASGNAKKLDGPDGWVITIRPA